MKIKLLFTTTLLSCTVLSFSQTWSTVAAGTTNTVFAFATDQTNNFLYIGQSNSPQSIGILKWNGSTISNPMPYNVSVSALGIYNNELYCGFNQGQGIAKWDGTAWVGMGTGLGNGSGTATVYTMCVYNGELYVGGKFGLAGGNPATNIAKWDGTNWSAVDAGLYGSSSSLVYAMSVYNSELYIGGNFTMAGASAMTVNNIVKWNGTSYSVAGSGVNGTGSTPGIHALCNYAGNLYAGGGTTDVLDKWDGTAWSTVTAGMIGVINALQVYNGALYAGGSFQVNSIQFIAKWDGFVWSALGTGVNSVLYGLGVYAGDLYVGGQFTTAGGLTVSNIAKWNDINVTSVNEEKNITVSVYPNPTINKIYISNINNPRVKLYDLHGKPVLSEGGNEIDVEKMESGIYFLEIMGNETIIRKKIIKL